MPEEKEVEADIRENTEEDEKLKKLLEPQPVLPPKKTEVEEFLDIKVPEVVTIDEEKEEPKEEFKIEEIVNDNEEINPFQVNTISLVSNNIIQDEPIIEEKKEEPVSEQISEPLELSTVNNDEIVEDTSSNESLVDDSGEPNLPRIINKVRDFIGGLDEVSNLITTSELDLSNKYQIVIEIDKNTD